MKILMSSASMHFSDHVPAGETQIAYGFASSLAGMGHRVTVLSPRVSLSEGVEGLRAVELNTGYRGSSNGSYASEKFLWWKFSMLALREARRILRNEGIDVIHHLMPAHEGKFSLLSGLGPPVVYGPMLLTWKGVGTHGSLSSHTDIIERVRSKLADRLDMHLGNRLYRKTLSRARVILVSSKKLRTDLDEKLLPKVTSLKYGVDTVLFQPDGDGAGGLPIVLFLGLLNTRKGIYDLLQAFSNLQERVEAKLVVVGGGDFEQVKTTATRLGIGNRVEVLGEIPHTEVPDQFKRCTLFCLPSHGEPFGMVLLQAMASGKPVVATRGGGVGEIVDDGVSGILVEEKNPAQLAEAIERLLLDRESRKRMGAAARFKAVSEYDWMVVTRKLLSVYEYAAGG